MITQQEFEEKVDKFYELEDARAQIGEMASNLIIEGKDIEAYLLILATWNFAYFRYILLNFNIDKFQVTIKEINPIFNELKDKDFKTADFDKINNKVSFIYSKLNELVKQTGATKIMHFKNPSLFVMWDINIRKVWKIPQTKTSSKDYIDFLKLMQREFSHISWDNKKVSFARAIDMYNYAITQEKIRSKRDR